MIAQSLTEHGTVPDLERTSSSTFNNEKQRSNRLMLWGLILMFIGIAIGVIGKKLMHEDVVTVVGVLVSLAGMFLTVYPYLSPSPRQKSDSSPTSQPELQGQSQSGKYLAQGSNIEYVPSVTERTTSLLKNPIATIPRRKEDEESET